MDMQAGSDSFLIYTASDPIACALAEYLEEEGYLLQASLDL